MSVGKYPFILHPHADKSIDIEEAAVRQIVRGGTPPRQAIILTQQQSVEFVGVAVQDFNRGIDVLRDRSAVQAEPRQKFPENLLVSMTPVEAGPIGLLRSFKTGQGVRQKCELPVSATAGALA